MTTLPQQVSSVLLKARLSGHAWPGAVQVRQHLPGIISQRSPLAKEQCVLLCPSFQIKRLWFISEQNSQRPEDTKKSLDIEAAGGISMFPVWPRRYILSKDQENKPTYWNEASPSFCLLHRDFYLYFEILLMKIKASPTEGLLSLVSFGCLLGETGKAVDLVQVWIQREGLPLHTEVLCSPCAEWSCPCLHHSVRPASRTSLNTPQTELLLNEWTGLWSYFILGGVSYIWLAEWPQTSPDPLTRSPSSWS